MKLNTLSIVIAYSGENQYLDELMASILANSNLHEIIIGVDETKVSKAHAIEVWSHWTIAAHEKGIPFAITFSQKPGPSAVRNAAIAHSGSDLILPVDSDDKISNSYVQRIIEAFNSDPEVGIVYGRAELFGKQKGEWRLRSYQEEEMVLENCIYATSGFKKSDWEAVGGYDEELIYGMEDWDFWLKILGLGRKVHFLDDEVVFYYRIRSGSRSAKFRKMRDEVLWTYNRICSSNKGIMMRNVEAINSRRLLIEINNLNSRALLIRLIYRIMIKTPFLKNQVNSRFAQLFKKRAAKI